MRQFAFSDSEKKRTFFSERDKKLTTFSRLVGSFGSLVLSPLEFIFIFCGSAKWEAPERFGVHFACSSSC
jgi:hypothetical protein